MNPFISKPLVKYCLRNKAVKAEVFSGYYVGEPQVIYDLQKFRVV
jgi:hypothetical protein